MSSRISNESLSQGTILKLKAHKWKSSWAVNHVYYCLEYRSEKNNKIFGISS